MRLATFNVRGLTSEVRKQNLISDAETYNCDLISLQETKIQHCDRTIGKYRLLTFNSTCRHYGLGFVISPGLNSRLYKYWSVNDRIAVIRFTDTPSQPNKKKTFTTIINVYGPTSVTTTKTPQLREQFYDQLQSQINQLKGDNIIVCGDFNSKIGQRTENESSSIGSHTKGKRNNNGEALSEFCLENNVFISNSAFRHKSRHITTWQGQFKDKNTNSIIPIYNQIDYIIIPQWLRHKLIDSRSYAGTLTTTDHRLLITSLTISNKRPHRKQECKTATRYHTEVLDDENTKIRFQKACSEYQQKSCKHGLSPSHMLQAINTTITSAANQTLPKLEPIKRKDFCPTIAELSKQQKELRLQISSTKNTEIAKEKKKERNRILHKIKEKSLENANTNIDKIVQTIEICPYTTRMYKVVDLIRKKPPQKIAIHDDEGHFVEDEKEKLKILNNYFTNKYDGPNEIPPFDNNTQSALENPITSQEVLTAVHKLNNNKAPGLDNIQAELLKAAPESLMEEITSLFNDMFEKKEHIDIGSGKLILLPKPGKPTGPPSNLRPIVLLPVIRKILSLITLERIREKVNDFLSPSQAGFRALRSTADIVWTHRWLISRVEKYKEEYTILGVDMSSAFDTIDRKKLLDVCQSFLEEDEIKMIRCLLSNTNLTIYSGDSSTTIQTIMGTPQGDGLSPVLFIVYLEAALRELRPNINPTEPMAIPELIYADDIDFIFRKRTDAEKHLPIITKSLGEWNLKVNEAKTEFAEINRTSDEWRKIRKLGSLLDQKEDVKRRKTLAIVAFNNMNKIWIRRHKLSETKLIRLYNALVIPILTYNCGTWGLTKKESESLDAFHRKQLRRLLNIKWDDKVSNKDLYIRCHSKPLSEDIKTARWRLFGHVLRRDQNIPAQMAMEEFYQTGGTQYPGFKPTNLHTVLNDDLTTTSHSTSQDHTYSIRTHPNQLSSLHDLHILKTTAEDKNTWQQLVARVTSVSAAKRDNRERH